MSPSYDHPASTSADRAPDARRHDAPDAAPTTTQWWLVDDFGDGDPVVGPFASYADAAAHDPTDDRLEPAQVNLDRPQVDAKNEPTS